MTAAATTRAKGTALSSDLLRELTSALPTADAATLRAFLPAVYDELRAMALGFLRDERPDHTLQPTALVHEAYLRMADQRQPLWQSRAQLLAVFARMMRRILIDHANAHAAAKRGGKEAVRVSFDEELHLPNPTTLNLREVDEALTKLERFDAQQARVVEMRFFGGLTVEEIANVLAVSPTTVKREWSVAKRWLHRELSAQS